MAKNMNYLDEVNKDARETLDRYYILHDAESFFRIDSILGYCRECELTSDDVPTLIEMQNVLLMG